MGPARTHPFYVCGGSVDAMDIELLQQVPEHRVCLEWRYAHTRPQTLHGCAIIFEILTLLQCVLCVRRAREKPFHESINIRWYARACGLCSQKTQIGLAHWPINNFNLRSPYECTSHAQVVAWCLAWPTYFLPDLRENLAHPCIMALDRLGNVKNVNGT
jgi:hypothetical protein